MCVCLCVCVVGSACVSVWARARAYVCAWYARVVTAASVVLCTQVAYSWTYKYITLLKDLWKQEATAPAPHEAAEHGTKIEQLEGQLKRIEQMHGVSERWTVECNDFKHAQSMNKLYNIHKLHTNIESKISLYQSYAQAYRRRTHTMSRHEPQQMLKIMGEARSALITHLSSLCAYHESPGRAPEPAYDPHLLRVDDLIGAVNQAGEPVGENFVPKPLPWVQSVYVVSQKEDRQQRYLRAVEEPDICVRELDDTIVYGEHYTREYRSLCERVREQISVLQAVAEHSDAETIARADAIAAEVVYRPRGVWAPSDRAKRVLACRKLEGALVHASGKLGWLQARLEAAKAAREKIRLGQRPKPQPDDDAHLHANTHTHTHTRAHIRDKTWLASAA